MGLLDVIGPVMVGPSSSHTAGAVRMGLFARLLLGRTPRRARIGLHGSFAATGEGHGTPLALLAGLLGLEAHDERIPQAEDLAREAGLEVAFEAVDLGEAHPNSARLELEAGDATLDLLASSVGGGAIRVWGIDGFDVDLDGRWPTILMAYPDRAGAVAVVSAILSNAGLNIATLKAHRIRRGGRSLMAVSLDEAPGEGTLESLRHLPHFDQVRYIPALGGRP